MVKYSNRTVTFGIRIIECSDNRSSDNREPTVIKVSFIQHNYSYYALHHNGSLNVLQNNPIIFM